MSSKVANTFCGGILSVMALAVLGCGTDAPETYHVSGTVTFDGKPVPAGQIRFVPDGEQENSGPAGFAAIKDGKFDTSAEGGKGHVGGPMIVHIDGSESEPSSETGDESGGEPNFEVLFPTYQTTIELPKETTTKDFEVPAEAGNVKPGGPV